MAKLDDVIAAKNALSQRLLYPQMPWRADRKALARATADASKSAKLNLHGVGVGWKFVDGKQTGSLCVRFYVLSKLTENSFPAAERLPPRINGIDTDVIESPPAIFHAAACSIIRRKRVRSPLVAGVSAGHELAPKSTTLGCFCHSLIASEANQRFMLSCNHAFANLTGPRGAWIRQPSTADGGGPVARIGRVSRWVPLLFGGARPNLVDAAIAQLGAVPISPDICSIGPLKGITVATLGMKVHKHGRTTGYTEGVVTDVSMDPFVADYVTGEAALFINQHRVEPTRGYNAPPDESIYDGAFAAPGDSGSVIVEKATPRAVSLHFAGAYGISISNPIGEVCSQLKISIP